MSDLVEVSRDQFFAIMGPRDVHPTPERDRCIWRTRALRVIGESTPGYLGNGPTVYRVARSLIG